MNNLMSDETLSKQEKEELQKLQQDLLVGGLKVGQGAAENVKALLSSGKLDKESLARAMLAQKVLSSSGLSPEDLAKVTLLQEELVAAGADPEQVLKHKSFMKLRVKKG